MPSKKFCSAIKDPVRRRMCEQYKGEFKKAKGKDKNNSMGVKKQGTQY